MNAFVAARLEFLELSRGAGVDVTSLTADFLSALRKKVGEVRDIGMTQATSVLKSIAASSLSEEAKLQAASLVSMHTGQDDSSTAIVKIQQHEFVEHYLTASDWAQITILSGHADTLPGSGDSGIMNLLADRFVKIGLLHPSEQCVRRIIAVKTLHQQQHATAPAALVDVREFKKVLRSSIVQGMSQGPSAYPASPTEFKLHFAQLYSSGYTEDPVPCPHSKVDVLRALCNTPCRSTKATCRGEAPARDSASSSGHAMQPTAMAPWVNMQSLSQMPHPLVQLAMMDCARSSDQRLMFPEVPMSWMGLSKTPPAPKPQVGDKPPVAVEVTEEKVAGTVPTFPGVGSTAVLPAEVPVVGSAALAPVATPTDKAKPVATVKSATDICTAMAAMAKPPVLQTEPAPDSSLAVGASTLANKVLKKPAASSPGLKRPAASSPSAGMEGLPTGWRTVVKVRKSGTQKGTAYTLFMPPHGTKQLRSMKEVNEFIKQE